MSEHQKPQPPHQVLELQSILEKLDYVTNSPGKRCGELKILFTLAAETREYLQETQANEWPVKPDKNLLRKAADETAQLKSYLGWALGQEKFNKAVAALGLLEASGGDAIEASLFNDVMQYIEQKTLDDVIPPQLLISWARLLQNKGDLHGTIRRLNAAQKLLEHKSAFPCPCEAERIRGDCKQLAGLTLNKMCCWKSAVQPFMESVETFRHCAAGQKTSEAIVVSMEMIARCLCNITHGDYLELKEQLGFQCNDRFYQAYTMCKEAAAVAGSSELFYIRAQNQAAESLLKFSAQQEDVTVRYKYLEKVLAAAQYSLRAHTSTSRLARTEQFFEFVHSLFLIFMALDFSESPQDRRFSDRLGEQARFLYAEYCRQLSHNGFQSARIDVTKSPEAESIISDLVEEFNLKFNFLGTAGTNLEKARQLNGLEQKILVIEEKERNGHGITKVGETTFLHRRFHDSGLIHSNSATESLSKVQTNDHIKVLQDTTERSPDEREEVDKEQKASPAPRRQEVGLPVDPEEYAIPVYDVPLTIFQDLCGCKFTGVQTHEGGLQLLKGDGLVDGEDSALSEESEDTDEQADLVPTRGITQDSGYGSSVVLVNTFLTTKLPESDSGSSSDADSGIESFSSSADSGGSRSSEDVCAKTSRSVLSENASAISDSVKKARLLKFNPVTGLWSSQITLVYVGQPLPLEDKLKGNCRDALDVQFLHQDEVLGRYVGKRYRRQRPPSQYLQDVTCQKTARFLVTLFNYALKDLRYDIQVVYVPVAHVQLLSRDGDEVEDWLNVEPYLEGDFIKLTNNLKFCNSQGRTLATALTHFTHFVSEGKLMLVDLQGWLPREGRGVVYLTDPQFHTASSTSLSSCDMGQRGMQAFWESVHPQCNAICDALGLKRPEE